MLHGLLGGCVPLICLGLALMCFGCGEDPQTDATDELAASFEGSPAQQDIVEANAALNEGRYKDANAALNEGRYKDSLVLLHKVASRVALTERQRAAMAGIVGQLLKAVHEDPHLSQDVQLHRMMELLVRRTMGET
ncbi:MAG: hypothetical protein P8Z79_02535 [Sedimentisphaerales bacterium]